MLHGRQQVDIGAFQVATEHGNGKPGENLIKRRGNDANARKLTHAGADDLLAEKIRAVG